MLDGRLDIVSSAGLLTYFAMVGRVGVHKLSTAAVRIHNAWGAAKELSCQRLARLHGLISEIGAH